MEEAGLNIPIQLFTYGRVEIKRGIFFLALA
jgi:hypothetical protein